MAISACDLARFPAVRFDERLVAAVEAAAAALGKPVRRMVSGAGHDAQIMASVAPSAMIFVPSVKGSPQPAGVHGPGRPRRRRERAACRGDRGRERLRTPVSLM